MVATTLNGLGSSGESHRVVKLVTGKLSALNWGEFFTKIAPVMLAVIIGSGTIVKFYGDSKSRQLEQLIAIERQRVEDVFREKLKTLDLEMKIYVDEKRRGRFTQDMFDNQMVIRDSRLLSVEQKQDDVRERLVADLRTDLERIESQMEAHILSNHSGGK